MRGNSSVTIPAIQVLEADGNAMEKDVEEGIVEVSFTEISMKGSVDLVASMALLAIWSLTIIFGAVWSLSDLRASYHHKDDGRRRDGDGESQGTRRGSRGAGDHRVERGILCRLRLNRAARDLLYHAALGVHHHQGCLLFRRGARSYGALLRCVPLELQVFAREVDLPVVGTVNSISIPSVGCAIVAVLIWLLNQGAAWAWMLQDIMGMSFLVNVLRLVHLPNLKVGSMLLMGAMCYDIFWVYIQPHLFGHESVMVKVAKGGERHESLPMLFLFPRLGGAASDFSMLGYGDVILPGLLIVHNHLFDNRSNETGQPRVGYLLPSIGAYVVGLLLTFTALFFEVGGQGGQPALCYLVPTVLGVPSDMHTFAVS